MEERLPEADGHPLVTPTLGKSRPLDNAFIEAGTGGHPRPLTHAAEHDAETVFDADTHGEWLPTKYRIPALCAFGGATTAAGPGCRVPDRP